MTSLSQTSGHKMAAFTIVFSRLSNVDFLKDENSSEKLLCFHRFNKFATKNEKWEAQAGMCRWSTSTLENSCGCNCPGRAGVKGNDRANRLAGKATSQMACFSEKI